MKTVSGGFLSELDLVAAGEAGPPEPQLPGSIVLRSYKAKAGQARRSVGRPFNRSETKRCANYFQDIYKTKFWP